MDTDKLKSLFQQITGLKEQLESDKSWIDASLIQETYHPLVDELSEATKEDCSKFKISNNAYQVINQQLGGRPTYKRQETLVKISMAHGYLKHLLGISDNDQVVPESGVTIINHNTLAVDIKYTVAQLIDRAEGAEEKEKLSELETELSRQDKNWDEIKKILIWILNFSRDLFIQVVPELLKRM